MVEANLAGTAHLLFRLVSPRARGVFVDVHRTTPNIAAPPGPAPRPARLPRPPAAGDPGERVQAALAHACTDAANDDISTCGLHHVCGAGLVVGHRPGGRGQVRPVGLRVVRWHGVGDVAGAAATRSGRRRLCARDVPAQLPDVRRECVPGAGDTARGLGAGGAGTEDDPAGRAVVPLDDEPPGEAPGPVLCYVAGHQPHGAAGAQCSCPVLVRALDEQLVRIAGAAGRSLAPVPIVPDFGGAVR